MKRDVAVIILYTAEKKILLQQRAASARVYGDHWAFFGGGIEKGESPGVAVRRECFEELQYVLENPRLVGEQRLLSGYEGVMYVFMEQYDPTKTLVCKEGKDYRWFSLEETKTLTMIPHDRLVIERLTNIL